MPFDQISARLLATMATLQETLKSTDQLMHRVDDSVAPQVNATLKEAEDAMKNAKEALSQGAPLQNDLGSTLLELSHAATFGERARGLPRASSRGLIRGKPADPK